MSCWLLTQGWKITRGLVGEVVTIRLVGGWRSCWLLTHGWIFNRGLVDEGRSGMLPQGWKSWLLFTRILCLSLCMREHTFSSSAVPIMSTWRSLLVEEFALFPSLNFKEASANVVEVVTEFFFTNGFIFFFRSWCSDMVLTTMGNIWIFCTCTWFFSMSDR